MSLEGYQLIENTQTINGLLTDFYEQIGYSVSDPHQHKAVNPESAQRTALPAQSGR